MFLKLSAADPGGTSKSVEIYLNMDLASQFQRDGGGGQEFFLEIQKKWMTIWSTKPLNTYMK